MKSRFPWFDEVLILDSSSVLPHIMPFSLNEDYNQGDSVQLTCHISKGDRPIQTSWTFQGRPISSNSGVDVLNVGHSSILTIMSPSAEHSGNYTCTAVNRAGASSLTVPVHINGSSIVVNDSKVCCDSLRRRFISERR